MFFFFFVVKLISSLLGNKSNSPQNTSKHNNLRPWSSLTVRLEIRYAGTRVFSAPKNHLNGCYNIVCTNLYYYNHTCRRNLTSFIIIISLELHYSEIHENVYLTLLFIVKFIFEKIIHFHLTKSYDFRILQLQFRGFV